jgi:hypothetical protein
VRDADLVIGAVLVAGSVMVLAVSERMRSAACLTRSL